MEKRIVVAKGISAKNVIVHIPFTIELIKLIEKRFDLLNGLSKVIQSGN